MQALRTRPPRDKGPLELRDYGPNGCHLGTSEDCYDGSPWELHRGELVEQMGSNDIHAVVTALIAAFFRTHARVGLRTMTDVYCDLSDALGPSVRAPDVVLVSDAGLLEHDIGASGRASAPCASDPQGDFVRVIPVVTVEVRATQSKKHLDAKVKLYLEHSFPLLWIAHAERREIEVVRPGVAPVLYRPGSELPLPAELDRHGLHALPVAALFDEPLADRYTAGWVRFRTLTHLFERRLGRALAPTEAEALRDRIEALGPERVTDAALDLTAPALADWLHPAR